METAPEEEPSDGEAWFRQLMDRFPDALLVSRSQAIVYVNRAGLRLLGATEPGQVLGRDPLSFVHPEHRSRVQDRIRQMLDTGALSPLVEEKLVRLDGSVLDVEVAVLSYKERERMHLHVLLRETAARKQAEKALHESEERFRRIFEESPLGMILVDRARRILRVNARICWMLGWTEAELQGRRLIDLMHPDDVAKEAELARRLRAGESAGFSLEARFLTRRGEVLWGALRMSLLGASENVPQFGLGMVEDITARKQAEEQMHRLQTEAIARTLTLEAVNRVALDILAGPTGIEAIQRLAETACRLVGAPYAAVGVAQRGGGLAEFITVGMTPEEERAVGARPQGRGLLGLLLRRTEPLRLDRLSEHPDAAGFPPGHPAMERFLGVPIRLGDAALGSLYLTRKPQSDRFTEADVAMVQALAFHAAVAIRNLHLLKQQRALVSGLIAAQEEERRAIAYDLHDGLTQYVMGAHAHLQVVQDALESGQSAEAADDMAQGLQYLEKAVLESRRLVNGLRALALDDLGLAGAVEQLLSEEKARAGWQRADLEHDLAGRRLGRPLEAAAFRVAQELLTNARKHADTRRVLVTLTLDERSAAQPPTLTVAVRDWGKGFRQEAIPSDHSHLGLHGVAERVRLLSGELEILHPPEGGILVQATFPVPAPPPPEAKS